MANKRLGKGLEALISSYSTDDGGRYVDGAIPINQIIPNSNQPRHEFNTEKMEELTASIKSAGILQPLTVREIGDNKFELIAGERRLRAAKKAGLQTVPVYILSVDADVEMMEYALVENVQRVDLNPIEEAEAFAMLSGKYDLSHDEIANRVGKNRSTIANSLRLLKLPPEIKSAVKAGKISAGHARAILSIRKSLQMMTASAFSFRTSACTRRHSWIFRAASPGGSNRWILSITFSTSFSSSCILSEIRLGSILR